jgi:hypothetical protein
MSFSKFSCRSNWISCSLACFDGRVYGVLAGSIVVSTGSSCFLPFFCLVSASSECFLGSSVYFQLVQLVFKPISFVFGRFGWFFLSVHWFFSRFFFFQPVQFVFFFFVTTKALCHGCATFICSRLGLFYNLELEGGLLEDSILTIFLVEFWRLVVYSYLYLSWFGSSSVCLDSLYLSLS